MGSSYSAPQPQTAQQVLQSYQQYLPSIIAGVTGQDTTAAQNQLAATKATQPGYDALNLSETQKYAVPLAQAGQQVTNSNALAGAQTNVNQIQGPGGQAAIDAANLARATNPDYYKVQDASSNQATNLVNSYNLNGLSPGEQNSVERSLGQSNTATGNLGLDNATNMVSNAMNFGDAYNAKRAAMNTALNTANQTATSAQNTGFSPVNIALGQPNSSTMGNFGTGTYSPTNASTSNANSANVSGIGNGLLGSMSSMNNSFTSAVPGQSQAQAQAMSGLSSSLTGGGGMTCCFIFLEATNGKMPWWVRECRNEYYKAEPQIARGYSRMAKWLVPLMKQVPLVKFAVNRWMVQPITLYGGYIKKVQGYEDCESFEVYKKFWFNIWRKIGA
jgi:hypothetical protein